ncbi:MAG: hypothetical protein JWM59_517 [Verrucomicrobiales bacterium]|nr:hypothetical protein [Verrucomicrobiales bacterium]
MNLLHGLHLAYCTNIHRGETWPETMAALEKHTLAVKAEVCPDGPYAIGLRVGAAAAKSLVDRSVRQDFKRWLDRNGCYVFTINGFPYGQFHGTRVKEQVFQPDWSTVDRVDYTQALFTILADLVPPGTAGSVSTVPGTHKELLLSAKQEQDLTANLGRMATWIARLSDRTGIDLHLGVEPEPLGYLETTGETVRFFEKLGQGEEIRRCLGVNYDTCHLAVEFEDAAAGLTQLTERGIRLSKLHLSSALRVPCVPPALKRLREFQEDVYFHQTIARRPDGSLHRFRDLPDALEHAAAHGVPEDEEWRVHFHVPLHAELEEPFSDTRGNLLSALDWLAGIPEKCAHLEMETYTWEVLPRDLRTGNVVDQLVREYAWTLDALRSRKLA